MDKKITCGILTFLLMSSAFTTTAVPVSGKIIEESTGSPLEYVNIVLLALPDSAFVSGTVSGEDGLFRVC